MKTTGSTSNATKECFLHVSINLWKLYWVNNSFCKKRLPLISTLTMNFCYKFFCLNERLHLKKYHHAFMKIRMWFIFRIKMKYLLSFMSFFNQSLSQKDHIKIILKKIKLDNFATFQHRDQYRKIPFQLPGPLCSTMVWRRCHGFDRSSRDMRTGRWSDWWGQRGSCGAVRCPSADTLSLTLWWSSFQCILSLS